MTRPKRGSSARRCGVALANSALSKNTSGMVALNGKHPIPRIASLSLGSTSLFTDSRLGRPHHLLCFFERTWRIGCTIRLGDRTHDVKNVGRRVAVRNRHRNEDLGGLIRVYGLRRRWRSGVRRLRNRKPGPYQACAQRIAPSEMAPGEREHSDPKMGTRVRVQRRDRFNSGPRKRGSDSDRRRRAPFPRAPGEEHNSTCARGPLAGGRDADSVSAIHRARSAISGRAMPPARSR